MVPLMRVTLNGYLRIFLSLTPYRMCRKINYWSQKKFMSTGLMYAPPSVIRDRVHSFLNNRANAKVTNKYLVEYVSPEGQENPLQEFALDLLVQSKQLRVLDSIKYDKLITTLATDGVRELPYRYYELAQVYYSRWAKYHNEADRLEYKRQVCKYVKSYESLSWIKNKKPGEYLLEEGWYNAYKADLAKFRCDSDCNC